MSTENIEHDVENEIEVDFDDWLAGGERKAHFVTLYGRADLVADIEELERKRVPVEKVADEDRGLSDPADPNEELDAQITALWVQLDGSKREFRVSSRTKEELQSIQDEVESELKDKVDAATDKARRDANALAKRLGVKAVNDVNSMVRTAALKAADELIQGEVAERALADSTMIRSRGEWVQVTRAQMHKLARQIGNSQLDALNRAFSRAAHEAPAVTLPK